VLMTVWKSAAEGSLREARGPMVPVAV
jgi:hypothetical protein